jgi:hypothetical protein
VQHDVGAGSPAAPWNGTLESESMTMLGVDDPTRPARLARVREAVAAGHYRPPADAVAERLLAFLAPAWRE